jgi:hypothetical protein
MCPGAHIGGDVDVVAANGRKLGLFDGGGRLLRFGGDRHDGVLSLAPAIMISSVLMTDI